VLTRQQRVYHWERRSSSISSDRLPEGDRPALQRAIGVYRRMVGERLDRIRDAARAALDGVRPDRVEAVVQVLEDAAVYEWPRGRAAAERRVRAFELAAARHPLLDPAEAAPLLTQVFGHSPERLEDRVAALYADYPAFHRLKDFPAAYGPDDARADYDLGQAQALLYSALRVTVEARADLGHVVRYARLARLLYRIERSQGGAYRFVLDGPNSMLRHTHAYGVDFARFLAALVQARDWRLEAEVVLRKGWRPLTFTLEAGDGLRSGVPAPALFDSRLEAALAARFGAERDGWRLRREGAVLEAGEALLVPDFVFSHEDGTEVALEIVGYWTPEYLAEKLKKLVRVRSPRLLVAVPRALALAPGALPHPVLPFKTRILLHDLLPRLEALRRPP
jgi:predicted nuclease of restriction endonuclease-like RecB superfamily